MPFHKPLKWFLFGIAGLFGAILLMLAIISFFKIPISLEGQKGLIQSIATDAMERHVTIDGAIKVTTSLWPEFIIEDVHIKNPEGFADGDFAWLESARIEVGLLRFLLGKIRVKELTVNGLELSLLADDKGNGNWIFNDREDEPDEPEEDPGGLPEKRSIELASDSLVVDKLKLSNIAVSYFKPGMEKPHEFRINSCTGSARPGKPFRLTLNGTTLEEPYEISIKAASLQELLEENRSWLEIEIRIAQALLKFSGNVDLAGINRNLKLKLDFSGEGLQNFNRLLKIDLPPIPSYGLDASLFMKKGLIELTGMQLQVSSSKLTGNMKVDDSGSIPVIELNLHSPLIQINDFYFTDWSPFQDDDEESKAGKETRVDRADEKTKENADELLATEKALELLSPEFLKKFNAAITVSSDKVLSGEDQLGNGKIAVNLKNGRINLDPVNLNVPGGSLHLSMSVKPGRDSAEASLRIEVENFDFGILARRAKPETNMGGTINIDIDLKSSARDFTELLENGNGYFDFSAKPENLQSGIMDLWAINVISAIVSQSVKGQSHIEYLVGRWSMKNGILQPDVFVIDTTRMRICGKGSVDFNTRKLSLEVAPTPKKPEFFSLATPIGVQGDFSDFGIKIAPGGLIGTGIQFAISPLQVPLQTVFEKPIPADGSDLWAIDLGPANRDMKRPVGCRGW